MLERYEEYSKEHPLWMEGLVCSRGTLYHSSSLYLNHFPWANHWLPWDKCRITHRYIQHNHSAQFLQHKLEDLGTRNQDLALPLWEEAWCTLALWSYATSALLTIRDSSSVLPPKHAWSNFSKWIPTNSLRVMWNLRSLSWRWWRWQHSESVISEPAGPQPPKRHGK